jgi:ectoine hydroxylase-related dioxygenase (phytanoyl-CoA dioxygenase family)
MISITPTQIENYRANGAIVVEGVLDATTRTRMNQVLAQLVENSRTVQQHDAVYDLEPGHSAAEPRVRRIKSPHLVDRVFDEFMRSPQLLGIVQQLIGPAIRLHHSKLNLKAPRFGSPVEWHQDWAFYPHTNDDILEVGVMLDDTTLENGAMLYLPGSHQGPTHDHHAPDGFFCGAVDARACGLDLSKAKAVEGAAGSISLHHVRLMHGSAQNRSNKPRGLLLYGMAAADAYPLVMLGFDGWDDFHKRLLCGQETLAARLRDCPVRMPYPPAKSQGSIYENQGAVAQRYFEVVDMPRHAAT